MCVNCKEKRGGQRALPAPSVRLCGYMRSAFFILCQGQGVTDEHEPPLPLRSLSSKVTPALNFWSGKTPFSDKGGSEIPTSTGCQTSPGPARSFPFFFFFAKLDPAAFSPLVLEQGGAPEDRRRLWIGGRRPLLPPAAPGGVDARARALSLGGLCSCHRGTKRAL